MARGGGYLRSATVRLGILAVDEVEERRIAGDVEGRTHRLLLRAVDRRQRHLAAHARSHTRTLHNPFPDDLAKISYVAQFVLARIEHQQV